jgi:hypothetical protein
MKKLKDRLAVKLIRLLARAQGWVHWAAFGRDIWVSTDGTPHRYEELKNDHLTNIVRLLERRGETETNTYKRLYQEYEFRGLHKRKKHRERKRRGYTPVDHHKDRS